MTTKGFRDVLEMRRLRIPVLYDIQYQSPQPLVPRRLRYEVTERIGPRGETWTELDEETVRDVAEQIREDDVEAVAIALLHSYADDAHERRVEEIVREAVGDGVYVTRSSEILPEIREYERTSTAVVNAYVGPGDHALPGLARRPPARGGDRRPARGHAVERRHAHARDGAAQAGAPGRVRPRGGRDGVQLPRPPHRPPTPDLARHGRHHRQGGDRRGRPAGADERVRGRRRHQPLEQARQGRRPPDQAPLHRRLRDRRGRRQHRRDRRARHRHRRPASAPARIRDRCATASAARSRR